MIKVGLSGGLCSEYEKISLQFQKIGVPVFDADLVLKFMIHYDDDTMKDVKKSFGDSAFINGFINEKAFNSTQKINCLLDIFNSRLLRSYVRFCDTHKKSPYTIFKFGLLHERDLHLSMDLNINVFTPKDDRIERLRKKEDIDLSIAHSVICNGPDDMKKNKLSDHVIHNYYDSPISIIEQIIIINRNIINKSLAI